MLVWAENAGLGQLLGTTIAYSTGRDTKGIAVALHGRRRDTYCAGQAPVVTICAAGPAAPGARATLSSPLVRLPLRLIPVRYGPIYALDKTHVAVLRDDHGYNAGQLIT